MENPFKCGIESSGFKSQLVIKPTGKRDLGRPRRRREYNVRMDVKDVRFNTGIVLIQLRIGIIGEPF